MQLDPTTLAVIDKIREAGYAVSLNYDKESFVASTTDADGAEHSARGIDAYAVICQLAEGLGIDPTDA